MFRHTIFVLRAAACAAAIATGPAIAQVDGHDGHHGGTRAAAAPPAPATASDARDPHAYSGGYTLTTGPHLISSERILRLGDEDSTGFFLVDRLEAQRVDGQTDGAYDLTARYGRDFNRFVMKAEGEITAGRLEESRTEVLWSRAIASYWDAQLGLRHDTGTGSGRNWIAIGAQGLAPYWFEVDVAAYFADAGRTALRISGEYDLQITQKLILQPRLELAAYGKRDAENGIGKGLSTVNAGIRLRYEFTREFAPYLGVEWAGRLGETADLARTAGQPTSDTRAVAGVRFWF